MRDGTTKDLIWGAVMLFGVIAAVSIICIIGNRRMAQKAQRNTSAPDTVRVVVYDTLTAVQPAPVAVAPLPDAVKRLPRWMPRANKNAQRDSSINLAACVDSLAANVDSVAVLVPMEQKVYTDSANYRAVISGAWVALDTIEVYPRREVVTIKQPPDNRRWGVSLVAGYGWAGKWTPFVGVGVSCTLFRF